LQRGRLHLSAAAAAVAACALATTSAEAASTCSLGPGGAVKHVIYVQFDNQHLARDVANVPSDIQQTPALKDYLTSNGSLLSNDHTILISHTAGGIISSLTGLYPDRNGIAVSNSFGVFNADGSMDTSNGPAGGTPAFTYWTDPVTVNNTLPNLITDGQKNTPAPWVPFTRAGCTVGAFSIANMELENTKTTPSGDITKVFGNPSGEQAFADWSNGSPAGKLRNEAVAGFEGIAIHCSQADSADDGTCSTAHGGRTDALPDEPGGYSGFKGLFGAIYANQVVNQPGGFQSSTQDADGAAHGDINNIAAPVNDVYDFSHTATPATCTIDGGPCPAPQPIGDSTGNNGFPTNFSPSAAQTLGYVAAMQESGIPITYAYIRDAHDDFENCNGGNANGPGNACYVQQLRHQNQAFQAFFERLAADGIDKSNTMFVFTVEEGDHYAGGPATNQDTCDGVTIACTYTAGTSGPNTVGEITTSLPNLVQAQTGDTTPFAIHFDDAPTVYVPNAPDGPPSPTDPKVRRLEQEFSGLTINNPRTGRQDVVTQHIADRVTQDILHMNTTDPLRTPSFTLFGNADYFFQAGCAFGSDPTQAGCPIVGPRFAWNHGDDNPEIARTWAGIVGPNVRQLGETGSVWTDHTDLRPTMLAALGLNDDYGNDGNLVTQVVDGDSLPASVRDHLGAYQQLQSRLKQLNAPFGQFGHDAEVVSTTAVAGDDATYNGFAAQLAACRDQRDALAATIQAKLDGAAFHGAALADGNLRRLAGRADDLIGDMHALSQMVVAPRARVCGSGRQGRHGVAGARARAGGGGRGVHVSCTTAACDVAFASGHAAETRIVLRRGGRLVATGHSARAGRVRLHAPRALRHGRYTLVVAVLDRGRPQTVIQRGVRL
jgi:hypothetical protein